MRRTFSAARGPGGALAGAQLYPAFWRLVTRVCLHPEEVAQDPELRLEAWNLGQRLAKLTRTSRRAPAALLKAALAAQGILDHATVAPGTPAPAPEKTGTPGLVGISKPMTWKMAGPCETGSGGHLASGLGGLQPEGLAR